MGDIVHTGVPYTVSRKDDELMYLTHLETDYSVWCVVYQKVGGVWQYNQELSDENFMWLSRSIPLIRLQSARGRLEMRDFDAITARGYCYIDDGNFIKVASFSGGSAVESNVVIVLSTAVYQGKYYTVTFEPVVPQDPEGEWTFNYTVEEVQVGGGIEFVEIDIEATSINQETLNKLVDFNNQTLKPNFIVLTTDNETDTYPILMPSDNLNYVYRSSVIDGKYYQLTLDVLEEGANVNIEQISIGGQPTINLTAGETLTQDQFFAIKQKDVKVVSDDIDLFLSQRDEENDYPILTSTVYDNKYLQVTSYENEMAEDAKAPTYSVVVEEVSVGGSVNNVFTLTVQDFYSNESGTLSQENLEHLTQLLSTGDVTVEIRVPTEHPNYLGVYLTKSSYSKESGEIENTESYTFDAIQGSDGVDCFSLRINLTNGSWFYTRTNLKVAPE